MSPAQAFDNMLAVDQAGRAERISRERIRRQSRRCRSPSSSSRRGRCASALTSGPQFAKAGGIADARRRRCRRTIPGNTARSTAATATPARSVRSRFWKSPGTSKSATPQGKLLTRTDHDEDNKTTFTPILPFSFVRRAADYSRSMQRRVHAVARRKDFRLRRIVHRPRQARPEGRAVDR